MTTELTQRVGRNITYFRERAGVTQEILAENTPITLDELKMIESGVTEVKANAYQTIARKLGMTIKELFLENPTTAQPIHACKRA